ncbi:uncharacterized protein MAM_07581 [Metarhizium album ARSEF 1941]|uniref:Uncharacterized protein n=1 Tax=Metarhizium album (strain ARSEF 1941) TaxID=1081103 RepID=A0A0B2WF48_METAS|nr:uncharacterized protein MAM_07581 [Metarhizium album ARSEF 1941]KHN94526.1 hypothetical protein MAM_07581 [Metarhizium album ARSEF 1941]
MKRRALALTLLAALSLGNTKATMPVSAPNELAKRSPVAVDKGENTEMWWELETRHYEKTNMTLHLARALNRMHAAPNWSHHDTSSAGLTSLEFCAYIRGLAWMLSMSTEDIDALPREDPNVVLNKVPLQKGSLVRLLRTMTLLEKFLSILEVQLWETSAPGPQAQMRIAHCYTDYAVQTRQWLGSLQDQAGRFDPSSAARCLVSSRLNLLYRQHSTDRAFGPQDVAMRLYARESFQAPMYRAQELLTERFAKSPPAWWNPALDVPEPGEPLRRYLLRQETVFKPRMKHARFEEAVRAWGCASPNDSRGVFDLRAMRTERRLADRVTLWHDLSHDSKIRQFYSEIEHGTVANYADDLEKMSRRRGHGAE